MPGEYDFKEFDSSNLTELTRSSRIFTAWLAEYEAWIIKQMGRTYREECHAMFCKLPTSKPWLPPESAPVDRHLRRRIGHAATLAGFP